MTKKTEHPTRIDDLIDVLKSTETTFITGLDMNSPEITSLSIDKLVNIARANKVACERLATPANGEVLERKGKQEAVFKVSDSNHRSQSNPLMFTRVRESAAISLSELVSNSVKADNLKNIINEAEDNAQEGYFEVGISAFSSGSVKE